MDDEKTTEGTLMEIIDEFIVHHVEKAPYIYNVCNIDNKPNRSTARERSLFFNQLSRNFNDLYGYKMTGPDLSKRWSNLRRTYRKVCQNMLAKKPFSKLEKRISVLCSFLRPYMLNAEKEVPSEVGSFNQSEDKDNFNVEDYPFIENINADENLNYEVSRYDDELWQLEVLDEYVDAVPTENFPSTMSEPSLNLPSNSQGASAASYLSSTVPEPTLNLASHSQGRSRSSSASWTQDHVKSAATSTQGASFGEDYVASYLPSTVPEPSLNPASNIIQGRSRKHKSEFSEQQETLKGLLIDLKKKNDIDPSLVARVNIICQQMERLGDGKKGVAFINIMNIFKKFIKT